MWSYQLITPGPVQKVSQHTTKTTGLVYNYAKAFRLATGFPLKLRTLNPYHHHNAALNSYHHHNAALNPYHHHNASLNPYLHHNAALNPYHHHNAALNPLRSAVKDELFAA
ncbi:hypothetical protein Btru_047035 [Bulinus truncatus]|nr:hypothetical protein Btru_047035 [Bulinus truncatus]